MPKFFYDLFNFFPIPFESFFIHQHSKNANLTFLIIYALFKFHLLVFLTKIKMNKVATFLSINYELKFLFKQTPIFLNKKWPIID